jgi:hypothetical protein
MFASTTAATLDHPGKHGNKLKYTKCLVAICAPGTILENREPITITKHEHITERAKDKP